MKNYTVGFIFNQELTHVLLIHKTAPAWQVGLINGVGGKLEEGEDGTGCIVREVKEETGIELTPSDFVLVGELEDQNSRVEVFGAVYRGKLFAPFTFEKEQLEWFPIADLPKNVIPNLIWVIPLVLEKMKYGKIEYFRTKYREF